jgi:hypothetical protein
MKTSKVRKFLKVQARCTLLKFHLHFAFLTFSPNPNNTLNTKAFVLTKLSQMISTALDYYGTVGNDDLPYNLNLNFN